MRDLVVQALSVAGIVAVAVGAAQPIAVRAQGGTAALPPAVDPSWLQVDTAPKAALVQLVAGRAGLGGARKLNGFRGGGLARGVRVGGAVGVAFRERGGMVPRSAEVIRDTHPLPTGPVAPAFNRTVNARAKAGATGP